MRIALVSREYPPETAHGGIGTQTYLKAHGLSGFGHEVIVLSSSLDRERHEYQDARVNVVRIPGVEDRMTLYTEPAEWLTYSAEVAFNLEALHKRAPLDLVDFPEWGGEGFVHLLNQTTWNKIPAVVHLHGPLVMFAHTVEWPDIDSEFYRIGTTMERTSVRLADSVFSSSDCSADWCARHYGIPRDTIMTLHMGVDTTLFSPRDMPKENRPTIAFVGRVTGDKGAPLLVEAACSVAKDYPDLQLWLLGSGTRDMTEELQAKAAAHGFPKLLHLPGFVAREQLPLYLSRAHLFAAPSIYEPGPGLVYLEAMACGLPVIACHGAGAAEVVIHEENGLLIPPRDIEALTEALRRLLSEQQTREAMGSCARRYVLEKADSRLCLKQLETFYAGVVRRARAGLPA